MRLKRLELQGFKSFVDRTILSFNDSITGVVGPNGCGKSNIVDAILWVMGEQSPKHLRGNSMTDVIFNGCESRPATSMAEVSLFLDQRGVTLSPQYASFQKIDEISITRRLFRDGTSEYLINKSKCRLKDIHELFMDTGVGRRAYSIIEQGQIDRMINVKPEERQYLFEEVAGITKYKAKRKEAEKKLEDTRQNLLRLQDIVAELEKRIRSLKVQATRARRYKELKSELEIIDLFLMGRSLFRQSREKQGLEEEKTRLENRRSELDAQVSSMDAEITGADIQRVDLERGLREYAEQERDLSLTIQKLESDKSLLEEKLKHLVQGNEQSMRDEEEIDQIQSSLKADEQRLEKEILGLEDSLKLLDEQMHVQEDKLSALSLEKEEGESRRNSILFDRKQISENAIRLQNQVENGEKKENECSERRIELNGELTRLIVELDRHKTRLEEAESRVQQSLEKTRRAEERSAQLSLECQNASGELARIEEELFKIREDFHSKRSRLQSLQELQQNLEGYSPTAKEVLLKLENSFGARALVDVIQPEQDIEEHLEMLLGSDMNTLLVPCIEDARALEAIIREKALERVRIVALSESGLKNEPTELLSGTVSLLSRIRVEPSFESWAQNWFGGVYLSEGIEVLFSLRQEYPEKTFIGRDTKTIAHDDHSVTAGLLSKKAGVFARRREIIELEELCARIEEKLKDRSRSRDKRLKELKEAEKLLAETRDQLTGFHVEMVESRKEKEKLQFEWDRADKEYQSIMVDSEENLQELEQSRGQVQAIRDELQILFKKEGHLQAEHTKLDGRLESIDQETDQLSITLGEKKVERSRFHERLNNLGEKLLNVRKDLGEARFKREMLDSQRSESEQEMGNIRTSMGEVDRRRVDEEGNRNSLIVRISDAREEFNRTSERLGILREEHSKAGKKRDTVMNDFQQSEIRLTEMRSALGHLQSTALERYDRGIAPLDDNTRIDVEKLPNFTQQLEVTFELLLPHEQQTLLEQYRDELREKVSRYGEVNLTAIQEFDEIQSRYDFLVEQRADLEKSISILEEAIKKIDETTKTRFEETLQAVDVKFREIFPILFNGGKAELKLTLSENGIDTGVDVMVQPPGKKLQSMSLLSGGEKALTAVSLVLAIFARKPSPFCLLDEVDAPLDDANVSRFNTVIRKMAEKTQFIVITHNKKTMEITESLYGVTMEKPGISRMASVTVQ